MFAELVPVTVVIPTRHRTAALRKTLASLGAQSLQPAEVIIVDASDDTSTRELCMTSSIPGLASRVSWRAAETPGAASQRNEGVRASTQPVIGFMDDDVIFEDRKSV